MGIEVMGLKVPSEPVEIKELIRVVRAGLGGHAYIDWDSLAV